MSNLDRHLNDAVRQLKAASAAAPTPVFTTPERSRHTRPAIAVIMAFAVTVAVFIPVFGLLRSDPAPRPGASQTPAATTTTTVPTTQVADTTTTVSTQPPVPPACGETMPIVVVLPTDFTGPIDGPSPDALTPVEDGQLIVHWTGRDGSVELRWPPNTVYTADATWGNRPEGNSDGTFLVVDPTPRMMVDGVEVEMPPTAYAYAFLPTDLMQGPCDAVQLDIYKSGTPGTPATRTDAGVAETAPEGYDLPAIAIYPNLPRPRDLQLILETLTVDTVPPVLGCYGGPDVIDVPPNKSQTIVDGPVFDTPQQALEAMLENSAAAYWPKTGYFELIEPDGSITYGNPIDDMSPDPRPEGGLVISISVRQTGAGWTVDSWTTSGC